MAFLQAEVVVELEARRCSSMRVVRWEDGDLEILNLERFRRVLMASIERA